MFVQDHSWRIFSLGWISSASIGYNVTINFCYHCCLQDLQAQSSLCVTENVVHHNKGLKKWRQTSAYQKIMRQCQLHRLVYCTLEDESSSVVLGRILRHYSKEVSLEWYGEVMHVYMELHVGLNRSIFYQIDRWAICGLIKAWNFSLGNKWKKWFIEWE